MARFVVTSLLLLLLLLLAVTLTAAVEGRDVDESKSTWIVRKLLGVGDARPVLLRPIDGTIGLINSSSVANGRVLTGEDQCQRTCDQVKFRTMCRSLTKLPGVTTPNALLQAAVRAAINKANQAKRRVDRYAATYHGGDPLASMLSSCSEAYGNVAASLAETQRLIDEGRATGADLNRQLSGVTTDALDCNNAFEERPEITPPFPGTLRNVYRVVDNVLNIAYVVKPVSSTY